MWRIDLFRRESRSKSALALSRAIAVSYRRWAIAHSGWYSTTVRAPVPGDEEDLAVSEAFTVLVFAVLGAFELPLDIDRSYTRLVESVVTALSTWSASGGQR